MQITQKAFMFLTEDFDVNDWDHVQKEFARLLDFKIDSKNQLEEFIDYYNEFLDEVNNEDVRNYIRLSLDTANLELADKERNFSEKILHKVKPYFYQIEKKIYENAYFSQLGKRYSNYKRMIERNMRTYSKKNLELQQKEQILCLEYRKAISNIIVLYEGLEMTMIQMQKELMNTEHDKKEGIWRLINATWLQNKDKLDEILDQIINIRSEIAVNSGFNNYSEYMHSIRNRFDYQLSDLKNLHNAIEKVVVPALKRINISHRDKSNFFPWEEEFNNSCTNKLQPFSTSDDLINKNLRTLEKINANFAEKFSHLLEKGNLDVEVRKGKTPGGFCFPVDRTGTCFICMNITGKPIEANILIHELGHGIHSLYQSEETIREYRMFDGPGELTELPPKTMELLALEHYDQYYQNSEDIMVAKKERFIDILVSLRKYALIDDFEQWLYSNPNHTSSDRLEYYSLLEDKYNVGVNWSGLEEEKAAGWYKNQLIVIMPHYIISYALALIGAIAIYRNYKEDRKTTVEQFENLMRYGFSQPIADLYELAGAKLDFSEEYLKALIKFIDSELETLKS